MSRWTLSRCHDAQHFHFLNIRVVVAQLNFIFQAARIDQLFKVHQSCKKACHVSVHSVAGKRRKGGKIGVVDPISPQGLIERDYTSDERCQEIGNTVNRALITEVSQIAIDVATVNIAGRWGVL